MPQIVNGLPSSLGDLFSDVPLINKYVIDREETYIYPETGPNNYGNANSIIRFRLLNGLLDLRNSDWQFSATAINTGGTGTYVTFTSPIVAIVNRLRALCGTTVLADTLNWGLAYANKMLSEDPGWLASTATNLLGYGTHAQLITNNANANQTYVVNLGYLEEFLNKIIPADKLPSQITIELYLETNPSRVIESDYTGGVFSYTISNCQFHYSTLKVSQAFENMIQYPILIPYRSWENYTNQFLVGSTNIQTVLPFKKKKAMGMHYVARDMTNVATASFLGKFTTYLNYAIYANSRFKINSTYYPLDKVQNVYDLYMQLIDYYCVPYNKPVQYGTSWSTELLVSQNLSQENSDEEETSQIISGLDISRDTSSVIAEQIFNTPGPATLQEVQYYLRYWNVLTINSTGRIELFD